MLQGDLQSLCAAKGSQRYSVLSDFAKSLGFLFTHTYTHFSFLFTHTYTHFRFLFHTYVHTFQVFFPNFMERLRKAPKAFTNSPGSLQYRLELVFAKPLYREWGLHEDLFLRGILKSLGLCEAFI